MIQRHPRTTPAKIHRQFHQQRPPPAHIGARNHPRGACNSNSAVAERNYIWRSQDRPVSQTCDMQFVSFADDTTNLNGRCFKSILPLDGVIVVALVAFTATLLSPPLRFAARPSELPSRCLGIDLRILRVRSPLFPEVGTPVVSRVSKP
jgi:hypothetical protein